MLKIVIAEDAAIEREGLVRNIDWAALGMELAGAAEDGVQAWEFVQACRPDLLLTDIKMPLKDGIQLAKQVSEHYPSIKIVFFSGYEDFNFALEAIKSKVCEYILKPYTIAEITGALRKVAELILQEQSKRKEEELIRSKWEESKSYREESAFKALLYGLHESDRAADDLGLRDPKPAYALMLARIVTVPDDGESDDIAKQRNNLLLGNLLKTGEAQFDGGKLFMNREGEFLLLLNEERHDLRNRAMLERIGARLRDWIRTRMNADLVIGVSNPVDDPHGLVDCYKQTLETMKLGAILSKDPILFYEDVNGAEAFTRMDIIVETAKRIIAKRYMEAITLNDIAGEVFMSPNYLNTIFKKVTGKNMNKYLIEVRVAKAVELLQEADAVISRVAASVGYRNIAHFSTVFKKHTGLSPMEYRDNRVKIRNKS